MDPLSLIIGAALLLIEQYLATPTLPPRDGG